MSTLVIIGGEFYKSNLKIL